MNQSILALIIFVSWTLFLGIFLLSYRGIQMMLGKMKINEFTAGVKHGSEANWRMNRAHANALENLPIFATLVIVGNMVGMVDAMFTNICFSIVGARVLQSTTHLISTSILAVNIRFGFYFCQLACYIFLITKLF